MTLKIVELISILIVAVTGGMLWGPWLALTVSIRTFSPDVFLALTQRLNRNMAAIMTVLSPVALLSIVLVFIFAYPQYPVTCYFTLLSFVLYITALVVTVRIEVPLVRQIVQWTIDSLPNDWQQVRNRWAAFHIIRVITAFAGLGTQLARVVFN